VIAESYERIHRSNLVGMGILPLQYRAGESARSLGLTGRETFTISGIADGLRPRSELAVVARSDDGRETRSRVVVRLDGEIDVTYHRNGGVLHTVVRRMAGATA
jgi:aconitate hydratase